MLDWNDRANLDVEDLDPTEVGRSCFDVRKMDLPKFGLPKCGMPTLDIPALPGDAGRAVGFVRDAAYAGVGVTVVTVQKLAARRRELTDQVTARLREVLDAVG